MDTSQQIENYLIETLKLPPMEVKSCFKYPSESRFKDFFSQ